MPERSISPYNKSRTSISSSVFKYMLEPSTPAASLGTVKVSSRLQSSTMIIAVIILVVLAIGSFASALLSLKTVPVVSSIAISADASAEALFCLGINMQSDKAMAEQSIIKVVLRIV